MRIEDLKKELPPYESTDSDLWATRSTKVTTILPEINTLVQKHKEYKRVHKTTTQCTKTRYTRVLPEGESTILK